MGLGDIILGYPQTNQAVDPQQAAEWGAPFLDKHGNPTQVPIDRPGFFKRLFAPEYSQIAQQTDYNYQMQPIKALQDEATQRRILANRLATVDPSLWPSPGNKEQSVTFNQNEPLSPFRSAIAQQATSDINQGNPELRAIAARNEAVASVEAQKNLARNAAMRGLLGIPEESAGVEHAGNIFQAGEYGGQTALQPSRFRLQGEQLQGELGRQPFVNMSNLSDAQLQAELSRERLGLEPELATSMRNQAKGEAAESFYRQPGSPIANRVNEDGTITPLANNPMGIYPGAIGATSIMQRGGVFTPPSQQVGQLKSGLNIVKPGSSGIDPLTGQPAIARPSAVPLPSPLGASNVTPAKETQGAKTTPVQSNLRDVRDRLVNMRLLTDADRFYGQGRQKRERSIEEQIAIAKSRLPAIQQQIAKQRNPQAYSDILTALGQ